MTWKSDAEVYENIGRFTVDFEHVSRAMETCIRHILHAEGLTNGSVQEILLAGMTADPLATLLQRLIGQTLAKSEKEKAIATRLFKELRDLIAGRNDLIHSKWFLVGMGVNEQEIEIQALGEKLHANKEGTATKNLNLTKPNLEQLINSCREQGIRISLLTRCVIGVRTLTECFDVTNGNVVVHYEMLKPVAKSA